MAYPKTNQELYDKLDRLSYCLRQSGATAEGDRISYILHKVAWTSATELLNEIALLLRALLSRTAGVAIPGDLANELQECLNTIDGALDPE